MKYTEVCPGVYQVGGGGYTNSSDCCVYLLDGGGKFALIDCGADPGALRLLNNIGELVKTPGALQYIIVTHGHIDHIGGLASVKAAFPQAVIAAHRFELDAIELGYEHLTAADWYGIKYSGVPVELVFEKTNHVLEVGRMKINCLYTPGHTPGGVSPYVDWQGQRVLFGQDIHGPFNQAWGSNMQHWKESMDALLSLKADILCEGHFGVMKSKQEVKKFIERHLRANRF